MQIWKDISRESLLSCVSVSEVRCYKVTYKHSLM